MNSLRFTKQGYKKLREKYEATLASRPAAVEHLKKSREMGDLSENGYYKSSRAKLSFIDRQLRELSSQIKAAIVVEEKKSDIVGIGTTVILQTEGKSVTYEIVGDLEAEPSKGQISLLSPLGKSLAGKRQGDDVIVQSPTRKISYRILRVS